MSLKVTTIQAPDGEEIYIQYDELDSDELQAVGASDIIDDLLVRSTWFGYKVCLLRSPFRRKPPKSVNERRERS
ncbi:MAG: hypothetical protein J7647_06930 [Cyanobacteria bacterium SBLK]|nr:hypothetical protein [Cyanobacteria bacterium SBLK]